MRIPMLFSVIKRVSWPEAIPVSKKNEFKFQEWIKRETGIRNILLFCRRIMRTRSRRTASSSVVQVGRLHPLEWGEPSNWIDPEFRIVDDGPARPWLGPDDPDEDSCRFASLAEFEEFRSALMLLRVFPLSKLGLPILMKSY